MQYNTRHYNDQRYNIDGVYYASSLSEVITETDGTQLANLLKALSDSLSSADATVFFSVDQFLTDFAFLDDLIQIQFTNKALNDTIRLADWVSIERTPVNNEWYD